MAPAMAATAVRSRDSKSTLRAIPRGERRRLKGRRIPNLRSLKGKKRTLMRMPKIGYSKERLR